MSILKFKGMYEFLSNFSTVGTEVIKYEGLSFPTVEHAFQAAKTNDPEWQRKIQAAYSAGKAKQLGRRVPLRPDWEKVKIDVMRGFLRQKFKKGTMLASALLGTGDQDIVEGNNWHDTFWGKCGCEKHGGEGQNWLGRLLMEIRAELRRNQEDSTR